MSFKHGCRFTSVTKTSYCISNKDQCHFSIYQEVTLFFLPRGNTKSQSWFIGKHLSLTLPVTELPALTCFVNLERYIDLFWFSLTIPCIQKFCCWTLFNGNGYFWVLRHKCPLPVIWATSLSIYPIEAQKHPEEFIGVWDVQNELLMIIFLQSI